MQAVGSLASLEAHEAVEKWGNLDDWHSAIGTGPFILKDFVPGKSATLVKNPNYWGHDDEKPSEPASLHRYTQDSHNTRQG